MSAEEDGSAAASQPLRRSTRVRLSANKALDAGDEMRSYYNLPLISSCSRGPTASHLRSSSRHCIFFKTLSVGIALQLHNSTS